jgi:hypothetical protein
MKKHHIPRPGTPSGRRIAGRAQGRHGIDTYKLRGKLPEPMICPRCRAVYRDGRWQWMEAALQPRQAHEELCTACHRIEDQYPAGIFILEGHALSEQRAEIVRIARNQEQAEKGEHP